MWDPNACGRASVCSHWIRILGFDLGGGERGGVWEEPDGGKSEGLTFEGWSDLQCLAF